MGVNIVPMDITPEQTHKNKQIDEIYFGQTHQVQTHMDFLPRMSHIKFSANRQDQQIAYTSK